MLDKLDSMPSALRTAPPAPGEWSAAGVVEHLVLFEENVAGPWRQRLLDLPSPRAGFRSVLLSSIVIFVVSNTRIRVPTIADLEPKDGMGADDLRVRWDRARERLVAALPDDPGSAWILHPALGPLNSAQMGRLIASHLEHHLRHWPTAPAR